MSVMEMTHRRHRGKPGMGYVAVGSYNPATQTTLSNQPNPTGGGYQSMQTLASYLRSNVLKPALGGSDALYGNYIDPATMQSQLSESAQSYCVGGEYGGPNDPCAGVDNGTAAQASLINQLVQEYVTQVNAQGGETGSGVITAANAQGYQYTAFTPSYSVNGTTISYGNNGSGGIISNPNQAFSLPVIQSPNSAATQWSSANGGQPLPGYTPPAQQLTQGNQGASSGGGGTSGGGGSAISQILGSSSPANPGSTVLINGTPVSSTTGASGSGSGTVAPSWLTDPTQEVVSGLPNWGLVAAGAGGLLVLLIALK